jgi:epoxyqueuosine reductase
MMSGPDPAARPVDASRLREIGIAAGLDRVGFTSADPFTETRVVLERRKAQGLHGGMQFTYRNPARSTEPGATLATVTTLVVGARAYPAAEPPAPPGPRPWARVARYAATDHYGTLRDGLEAMAGHLRADGWAARVVLDDNALVDRAAAQRAGIGWFGKNANILVEGLGSSIVLGSVLTDAPLPIDRPVPDGCGPCARCLDACPTGALVAPGVLDARRCLAWLLQAEGSFPVEHRVALGDRIYGCDECQDACPPTIRFARRSTMAVAPPAATWVSVLDLLAATDDELLARHGRWYIPKRQPRYLRRNALVVLANTAPLPIDTDVERALVAALVHHEGVVRAHAVWAARRLGAERLTSVCAHDDDPDVVAELARAVPTRESSVSASPAHASPGAIL